MEIILSGGLNKYSWDSLHQSVLFTYAVQIKQLVSAGKKVAFVTLAKPDRFYDLIILPTYGKTVEIIDWSNLKTVDWSSYDTLFLLGGETRDLHRGLVRSRFSLSALKPSAILFGDSAGAMVMGCYYYDETHVTAGVQIKYYRGFNPQSRLIVIVHANNSHYSDSSLQDHIRRFAMLKNLRVFALAENQAKKLEEATGELVQFKKGDIFGS